MKGERGKGNNPDVETTLAKSGEREGKRTAGAPKGHPRHVELGRAMFCLRLGRTPGPDHSVPRGPCQTVVSARRK